MSKESERRKIVKKKKPCEKGDNEKKDQIEKEMLEKMKAKSDEKSVKGEEDERERATEKHFFFFLRIEQERDQNGRIPKKKGRKSRMKKRRKMEKQKKGGHMETHQKDTCFKNQMVLKKRGDTELDNSKYFFFQN